MKEIKNNRIAKQICMALACGLLSTTGGQLLTAGAVASTVLMVNSGVAFAETKEISNKTVTSESDKTYDSDNPIYGANVELTNDEPGNVGTANNNTLTILSSDKTFSQSTIAGGNVKIKYAGIGTAVKNKLTINAGYFDGAIHSGNVEIVTAIGAKASVDNKATANSNTLNINTDISAAESQRTFRGDIAGGYADTKGGTAQANENIVTVTGGKFISYNNVHISGGWARSIDDSACVAQANNNTIELKNIITDVRFGPAINTGEKDKKGNWIYRGDGFLNRSIYGGYATGYTGGTAVANENELTISGASTNIVIMPHATINDPDKGYSEGVVYAGYALNGTTNEANNNTLTIEGGTINGYSKYTLETEYGTKDATEYGYPTISDYLKNYTVEMRPTTDIGGGFAVEGTANNNKVIISGGMIGSTGRIINVYGANRAVQAKGNEVEIKGDAATITGNVAGAYIPHVDTEKIKNVTLEQNKVTISAGTVNGMVTGADGCSFSTIKGNEVIISGGTVNGKIYGGFAESGSHGAIAEGNKLTITGGTIKGDVHGGYVDDEGSNPVAKNNTVIIEGGSITGNVFGGGTWIEGERAGIAQDNTIILGAANGTGTANITGNVFINWLNVDETVGNAKAVSGGILNVYNTGNTVTENVNALGADIKFHVKNTDIDNTTSLLTVHNAGNTADMHIEGATVNVVLADDLGAGTVKLLSADKLSDDTKTAYSIYGSNITLGKEEKLHDKTDFYILHPTTLTKSADGLSLTTGKNWGIVGKYNGEGKEEAVLTDAAVPYATKAAGAYNDKGSGEMDVAGGKITINSGSFENNIYGGYSKNGAAKDNTVNISGGTVTNVYGGYSEAGGEVSNNVININGGTVTGTVNGEKVNVSDGKVDTSAKVNADDVAISGGTIAEGASIIATNEINVTGGTITGTAKANEINVTGGSIRGTLDAEKLILKGGTVETTANITDTTKIQLAGAMTINADIKAFQKSLDSDFDLNLGGIGTYESVTINDGKKLTLNGVTVTEAKADKVEVSKGNVTTITAKDTATISGGTIGTINAETTNISDGSITTVESKDVSVANGTIGTINAANNVSATGGNIGTINSAGVTVEGAIVTEARADKVEVSKGNVTTITAKDTATISGGTIGTINAETTNISDGSITTVESKDVSVANGTIGTINATDIVSATGGNIGTVNSDAVTADGATITGAINAHTVNLNKLLGNPALHLTGSTVNIYESKQTVSSLTSETGKGVLNFYIPAGLANNAKTDAMMIINGGEASNLNGWTVNAGVQADVKYNNKDKVVLLYNENGITTEGTAYGKLTSGVSTLYTAKMTADENSITATIIDRKMSEQTKSFVETQMANIAILNGAADLMAGQGFVNAATSVDAEQAKTAGSRSMTPFFATSGNSIRSHSGSYVDTRGMNLVVGMAKSVKNNSGKLTFGPMVEYGHGNYTSHLDDGTRGDGTSRSWGLGVFAKQENTDGMYYEGSIRAGAIKADYNSGDMGSYETDAPYISFHAGVGKNIKINSDDALDFYGKYFYTHQNADDVTIHTSFGDEAYNFGSVTSSRMRLGTRWTHQVSESNQLYIGAAWQYEFDGKAVATYQDMTTPSPSVKGGSGLYELGWKMTDREGSSIDLNLTGWSGKQEGFSVGAKFNFAF